MNVTHCSKRHACLVSAFVLLVGQATFVNAQQKILIDFGSSTSYRGIDVPNPDPNGNYWNSNQPGMLMDLVDVNNAATGMQLGWITEVGTDSYNGPAGDTSFGSPASNVPYTDVDEVALGDFGVKEAAFDFATGPNEGSDEVPGPANNTRFDLIGLDPAKTYSLSFYSAHSYNNDALTTYSVYSDGDYTDLVGQVDLQIHHPQPESEADDPNWRTEYNRDTIATIDGLSPGPDGNLYLDFVGSTGLFGYLNAMRIESIAAPVLIGDYNNNHVVDAADYTVWRNNLGTTNVLSNDPVGGTIGPDQYDNWKSHFGMTSGGGGVASWGGGDPGAGCSRTGNLGMCLIASVGIAVLRSRR